jgi:lysozyme
MNPLKARLTQQLRRDEDEVLHAYKDHLGFLTIGVGRLIDKRKGGGITSEESAYLLGNDIDKRDADLRSRLEWFPSLDAARQGALLNMAFQMGVDGLLGFHNTLDAVRDGHYAHAANLALQSLWAKQTPERARRIAFQIESGEWQ